MTFLGSLEDKEKLGHPTGCEIIWYEIIEALTGIMIGFQRRLSFIFAQVLVQISVHAFIVILRVIHCERITSSELDVVEYLIFRDFLCLEFQ